VEALGTPDLRRAMMMMMMIIIIIIIIIITISYSLNS
jgi:hypothetical protein